MPGFFIQGKGALRLSKADFKAQGGEGSIYVKGSTAYKIYADPQRMIQPAKILELSALTHPNIIRPVDVVLDAGNRPVGYSMRHVEDAYALCQMFPKAFRQRRNLTPDVALSLVRKLQEGVAHVHSKGMLVVDLNEMNFLVAEDFKDLFFIDVDSYQTPSFPATVLMESVRDRHAVHFTTGSDWFSFAVVSFQMFTGIHPFKGTYPPLQNLSDKDRKLDARMRANISVLHRGVSVPASCLSFNVIPPPYLDWYTAVFEEGKRLPPPDGAPLVLASAAQPERLAGSDHFEITELQEFDGEIISHDGLITITRTSIYLGNRKYAAPHGDRVGAVTTPRRQHLIVAYRDGRCVRFRDLTTNLELDGAVAGEDVLTVGGRFLIKQDAHLLEVEFIESAQKILLSARAVGNVASKSTQVFEGVAMQNLLGACYASIPSAPGACHQVRLRELDGYRIVDARLCRNVLVTTGARGGKYDRLIFRFAEDFSDYDVRLVGDVTLTGINFTVLDSGVSLHLNDTDELELFSRFKGSTVIKIISDPAIQSDIKLFRRGAQALFARGHKLYKLTMREPTA